MSNRVRIPPRYTFIAPCLPSTADHPPTGQNWVHEIKHDGYRLMARRDPVGIRLLTRNGPLIVEAVNHLKARSCLIDGEAVCCDDNGLAVFERMRRKRRGEHVFLYAFDLLELNGTDLRQEPFEVRKSTCRACCARAVPAYGSMNTCHTPAISSSATLARWAWRASCRSG